MNYIITKHKEYFEKIGKYNFCNLSDMILPDIISIDLETTGLTARNCDIFCTQIGTGENNYIIHMYDDNYLFEDLIPFINNKTLIGHNITFDLGFMYKHNFYPKNVKDTMIASKILYNGDIENQKNDFGSCMKRELNIYYDKTDQKNIHIVKLSQESTIKYSFNDVDKLLELENILFIKLKNNNQLLTYELHCKYVKALAYIEQCGLPINSVLWKKKMQNDLLNSKNFEKKIEEYIYDNVKKYADRQIDMFNTDKKILIKITSPLQMLKVFKELNINTKDKDGKESINENIISKTKHEFVDLWLKYQEAKHRVTTFGENIYNKIENERIYTTFNPMVDTARLSTRKGGINFLNFPSDKETRNCIKTSLKKNLIVCDYSGQETVIAADLSKDVTMTNSVKTEACLHCAFARVLFPELNNLSDEEIIKNHKSKRQAAKSPRFAFQYGGSAYTIHQNEGISLKEAEKIEIAFKELHSGLYVWGDIVFQQSIKTGYIESADGWKLKLPNFEKFKELKEIVENITKEEWTLYKQGKLERQREFQCIEAKKEFKCLYEKSYKFYINKRKNISEFFKLKSEYQRLSLNFPVQSRAAHQLKYATILLFEWIIKNNYQKKVLITNVIHDEMLVECTEELTEIVQKKVKEFMLKAGNHYLKNLTIKAEANIGKSWYQAK